MNLFKRTTEIDTVKVKKLKVELDELYDDFYFLMVSQHEKLQSDRDGVAFLHNYFPSTTLRYYDEAFGDVNAAIARQSFNTLYTDYCAARPDEVIKTLKNLRETKNIYITMARLPVIGPGGTLEPPRLPPTDRPEVIPVPPESPRIETAKYGSILLDNIEIKYPYANPLFAFEDRGITKHLEDINHK